ncbi:DNA-binding transcriptional regulator, MerR family [Lachnospiraceae bacterium XBB1006]|nr:DNA-binding transcriptional regulator, MerR family [Lachnospiraceae bacterium XBB1006]
MTIKEFARLCGCNPQTLRYYDRMELLKPVKVDSWTGYRYYEEEQALDFVKIKNLQTAGFTIEEIRGLADASNEEIYSAFEEKIKEAESRLRNIKRIQQSYQYEMTTMEKRIETWREQITKTLMEYDPTEEFGVDKEFYEDKVIGNVNAFFDDLIRKKDDANFSLTGYPDGEELEPEEEEIDFLKDPHYEMLYEVHGWEHVKDFLGEMPRLESNTEYALLFKVNEEKRKTGFANTMLGVLLAKYARGENRKLGCNVTDTEDGENHFWLFKAK